MSTGQLSRDPLLSVTQLTMALKQHSIWVVALYNPCPLKVLYNWGALVHWVVKIFKVCGSMPPWTGIPLVKVFCGSKTRNAVILKSLFATIKSMLTRVASFTGGRIWVTCVVISIVMRACFKKVVRSTVILLTGLFIWWTLRVLGTSWYDKLNRACAWREKYTR